MKVHKLKCWPGPFSDIQNGIKGFELRRNDRGFEIDDIVELHEYQPDNEHFTGQALAFKVNYILEGFKGLEKDFVILGFKDLMTVYCPVSPYMN